MARGRRRNYLSSVDEGINLTPLLDVIFNLIFFFVVATTIRTNESSFDLTLPTASEEPSEAQSDPIPVVTVEQDGQIFLNGQELDEDDFVAELESLMEDLDEQRVVLSADGRATVQQQTNAMDMIRDAGITQVIQRIAIEE